MGLGWGLEMLLVRIIDVIFDMRAGVPRLGRRL